LLKPSDLYASKHFHQLNNAQFVKAFSDKKFWWPNREKAPWQLQSKSIGGLLLNFYPHLLKAHADGDKCVVGIRAMQELFLLEDISLIEDDP